jgi:V/A-type H+-transporting ATPase subunit A
MLRLHLELHGRAASAVDAGVPLGSILEAGIGARLLRLGSLPAEAVARGAEALRAEIVGTLARLEAE